MLENFLLVVELLHDTTNLAELLVETGKEELVGHVQFLIFDLKGLDFLLQEFLGLNRNVSITLILEGVLEFSNLLQISLFFLTELGHLQLQFLNVTMDQVGLYLPK